MQIGLIGVIARPPVELGKWLAVRPLAVAWLFVHYLQTQLVSRGCRREIAFQRQILRDFLTKSNFCLASLREFFETCKLQTMWKRRSSARHSQKLEFGDAKGSQFCETSSCGPTGMKHPCDCTDDPIMIPPWKIKPEHAWTHRSANLTFIASKGHFRLKHAVFRAGVV